MENTDILHGSTSISLPGIEGGGGSRARLFFYGNSKLSGNTTTNNIRFTVNGETRYARRNVSETPEEYDYIFYTENSYDYIYLIKNVTSSGGYNNCKVEEIDKIDLSQTESSSSEATNFTLNIVSRAWSRNVRNINSHGELYSGNGDYDYYIYARRSLQTTYNLLYDFSITVPSTSNYVFTSDIKITLEFYTIQSAQMDSALFTKFDSNTNTYRGNIESYAIKDYNGNRQIINFDDERLENFSITIKDYNDGIGSKYFTNSIPLMAEPLRRYKANPRAFLCVYTKGDYFIKKSVISELDLSFILNASPTSNTPSAAQVQIDESF